MKIVHIEETETWLEVGDGDHPDPVLQQAMHDCPFAYKVVPDELGIRLAEAVKTLSQVTDEIDAYANTEPVSKMWRN